MRTEISSNLCLAMALLVLSTPGHGCEEIPADSSEHQLASVQRGQELFTQLGCASCHTPEKNVLFALSLYTNKELQALIESPASDMMPVFKLSAKDACALNLFLRKQFE